jgi:8-amino-7-oxononanoate synthase
MVAIEKFLAERRGKNLYRQLRPAGMRKDGMICFGGKGYWDFASNDYLGLAGHPEIKEAAKRALEQFGVGASASRLLSGDLEIHHQLEEKMARFKGKEAALVFNSGYQANVGIISALCGAGDAVFADRLCHASILDGIVLSGARCFRFRHNDINHLESLLKKTDGKFKDRLLVTETIFSMDGDRPALGQMAELKEKYNCQFMVDEAHATGIFGKNGSGIVEEEGLSESIDFVMGTFSKALGSFGAYIACSEQVKMYLVNACRSFIYSTALPPAVIAANIAALEIIAKEPFRRKKLLETADYFRNELAEKGLDVRGQSQIVPLIIGDAERAVAISQYLREKGYNVPAIRPPTVPAGQCRLRFSLTYHHKKEMLRKLITETCRAIDA